MSLTTPPERAKPKPIYLIAKRTELTHVTGYSANNSLSIDLMVDGFGGSEVTNLADGRYEVKFDTTAIKDLSGNTLLDDDGTDDGRLTIDHSTDSSTQDFYRLFGDSDGDGRVGFDDLTALFLNYKR